MVANLNLGFYASFPHVGARLAYRSRLLHQVALPSRYDLERTQGVPVPVCAVCGRACTRGQRRQCAKLLCQQKLRGSLGLLESVSMLLEAKSVEFGKGGV